MYGGLDEFNALAFGTPHPGSVAYFTKEYESIVQRADQFVGDLGQRFVATATQFYNNYVSPTAISRIKNILAHVKPEGIASDYVASLQTLEEIQHAGLQMQRWILADPYTREMYHDQRIDGYSDTYVDVSPSDIGMTHYDYRLVMDGLVQLEYDDEGEVTDIFYENYYVESELQGDDTELSVSETTDILSTWQAVRCYLGMGNEDPTSAIGGYL